MDVLHGEARNVQEESFEMWIAIRIQVWCTKIPLKGNFEVCNCCSSTSTESSSRDECAGVRAQFKLPVKWSIFCLHASLLFFWFCVAVLYSAADKIPRVLDSFLNLVAKARSIFCEAQLQAAISKPS